MTNIDAWKYSEAGNEIIQKLFRLMPLEVLTKLAGEEYSDIFDTMPEYYDDTMRHNFTDDEVRHLYWMNENAHTAFQWLCEEILVERQNNSN